MHGLQVAEAKKHLALFKQHEDFCDLQVRQEADRVSEDRPKGVIAFVPGIGLGVVTPFSDTAIPTGGAVNALSARVEGRSLRCRSLLLIRWAHNHVVLLKSLISGAYAAAVGVGRD